MKKVSALNLPRSASMPRMARFICAIFQVVGLESWPKTEMLLMLPPWFSMNFAYCTNIPPLPQQGA